MSSKFRRCMWFNEVGWPRLNPALEKKKGKPPVGCVRSADVCSFAHPDDSEWERASNSDVPLKYYGGRARPVTPIPPGLRPKKDLFGRDRTPERSLWVKEEQLSPKISFAPDPESGRDSAQATGARTVPHTPLRRPSPPPIMSPNERYRRDSRDYDRNDDRQGGSSRNPASGEASGHRSREPPKIASSSRSDRRDESSHSREQSLSTRPGESLLSRMQIDDDRPRDSGYRSRERSPPRTGRTPTRPTFREPSRSDRGYEQLRERGRERDDPHAHDRPYEDNHRRSPPRKTSTTPRVSTPPWNPNSSMAPPAAPQNGTIPPPPQPPIFADPHSSAESRQPNNAPRDIPPQKRRELWNERIILLSEAVSARTGQQQALADLARIQKLNEGARSAYMTVDTQKTMAHAVELAKTKVEEEKKRHNGIVEKLFASDFWPIRVKREGTQVDEDALFEMDSKIDEMKLQVMALADDVLRNDRMLREVVEWIGSQTVSTTVVDVVDSMESDRGLKRRRLDSVTTGDTPSVYETTSTSSSMTLVPTPVPEQLPTPTTATEFKVEAGDGADDISTAMQRIITLSNRLRNLEQAIQNASEESDERIKDYVDAEIEDFKKKFANKKGEHYTKRMLELKGEIDGCGRDISELSEELAALINGNVERNAEVKALHGEIIERRSTIQQLESDLAKERAELSEMRDACKQTTEEVKALSAAFKLQIAKTKEIKPPVLPSLEDLVALLEPRIKETVREDVKQMMSNARTEIVKLVRDQAVPVNSAFQEKLNKLTRLPEILTFLSNQMNNTEAADVPGPSNPSRPP